MIRIESIIIATLLVFLAIATISTHSMNKSNENEASLLAEEGNVNSVEKVDGLYEVSYSNGEIQYMNPTKNGLKKIEDIEEFKDKENSDNIALFAAMSASVMIAFMSISGTQRS